jgi:multisubunit Na+/H+ antiporter MnhF subunit
VSVWLWAATGLTAAILPLLAVAVRRPPIEGLVALQVAGTLGTGALLVLAEGTDREAFADLALALAAVSFAGTIAFLRFLEQVRS